MKEQFPNYAKKAAIAAKYGWKISGWAVDLDNPAGISLYPIHGGEHLRMQHKDSLKVWEATLSKCPKPLKASKGRKPPKTFDDVVAENAKLKAELKRLKTDMRDVGDVRRMTPTSGGEKL